MIEDPKLPPIVLAINAYRDAVRTATKDADWINTEAEDSARADLFRAINTELGGDGALIEPVASQMLVAPSPLVVAHRFYRQLETFPAQEQVATARILAALCPGPWSDMNVGL